VEPLSFGAVVSLAGLVAEGLQDGADGGGALGGEVAADHPGVAERGAEMEVALARAA
jgi:hypothetical protein